MPPHRGSLSHNKGLANAGEPLLSSGGGTGLEAPVVVPADTRCSQPLGPMNIAAVRAGNYICSSDTTSGYWGLYSGSGAFHTLRIYCLFSRVVFCKKQEMFCSLKSKLYFHLTVVPVGFGQNKDLCSQPGPTEVAEATFPLLYPR